MQLPDLQALLSTADNSRTAALALLAPYQAMITQTHADQTAVWAIPIAPANRDAYQAAVALLQADQATLVTLHGPALAACKQYESDRQAALAGCQTYFTPVHP